MKMHPANYFEVFVQGNYSDFYDNSYCLRRAFNACVSSSHMADIYFNYCKRNHDDIVKEFCELKDFIIFINKEINNKFKDIRSISNAYKHLYLDDDAYSSIASGGVLTSVDNFNQNDGLISISSENHDQNKNETVVMFTRKDGSTDSLKPILESVNNYWFDLIYK